MGLKKQRIAIIDLDFVLHAASCVGEERYIEVVYRPTGTKKEFSNKTEFYGRNTQGGWLKELNKAREEKNEKPFPPEEFSIVQKQRLKDPLENILHSAKLMVETALKASKANCYEAYIGAKGARNFRVEEAKMLKYKGHREDMLVPLMKEQVREYLIKKFNAIEVDDIEVDDYVVIRCSELLCKGKEAFVIAVDKDAMGCPVQVYNPNRPEEGVVDCRGFGNLCLDGKKVRGKGRLFKYWQIAVGDPTDNYKANARSSKKWADMGGYKALKGCTNDKEAVEVLEQVYKDLYPEPVSFDSWDGNKYTFDWKDCLNEIFIMAHMKEYEKDNRTFDEYVEDNL